MPIRTSGNTPNQFLYSGERYDSNIGSYDLRARYYDQATGRFWARDPIPGTQCCGLSWNPYIYTKDNPVNNVDPDGKAATTEQVVIIRLDVAVAAIGLTKIAQDVICQLETTSELLKAITQPGVLGHPQNVQLYKTLCSANSRVPHIPGIGPLDAPFDPFEEVTSPGSPWNCNPQNPNGTIDCQAPCPEGSQRHYRKLTYDPGSYGKLPHWDYTDCDGKTWYIWSDGSMSAAG